MSCNPSRIRLSNTDVTTVEFSIDSDPGDGTVVSFQVDALGIDETQTTTSGVATVVIQAVNSSDLLIYDATIQVGSNAAVMGELML